MKAQNVRLFDVFILGPFMVWSAGRLPPAASNAMAAAGLATIIYNGANWLREREREAAERAADQ